ncbi:hypothetical protein DFH09DRAFT_1097151 [Mycena vulgaris]|nr:hypothetical protein DFH09DRAFT_1097151 [Mycena vulgaris]
MTRGASSGACTCTYENKHKTGADGKRRDGGGDGEGEAEAGGTSAERRGEEKGRGEEASEDGGERGVQKGHGGQGRRAAYDATRRCASDQALKGGAKEGKPERGGKGGGEGGGGGAGRARGSVGGVGAGTRRRGEGWDEGCIYRQVGKSRTCRMGYSGNKNKEDGGDVDGGCIERGLKGTGTGGRGMIGEEGGKKGAGGGREGKGRKARDVIDEEDRRAGWPVGAISLKGWNDDGAGMGRGMRECGEGERGNDTFKGGIKKGEVRDREEGGYREWTQRTRDGLSTFIRGAGGTYVPFAIASSTMRRWRDRGEDAEEEDERCEEGVYCGTLGYLSTSGGRRGGTHDRAHRWGAWAARGRGRQYMLGRRSTARTSSSRLQTGTASPMPILTPTWTSAVYMETVLVGSSELVVVVDGVKGVLSLGLPPVAMMATAVDSTAVFLLPERLTGRPSRPSRRVEWEFKL